MSVLYRKYRPQVFADIAGQEHVKKTLCEEVASSRLAHSYLFTGPRGVGKTTMARIFAKAVNCKERKKNSGEPCDKCELCLQVTEGRALDVVEIDAASHTGVDNVREQIIENARFAPTNAAYKVFIIDEVHMLSTSAFNALLKTLEEPPAHVIFILATTELHKLPATVISRCQRFDFRKIPQAELVERLKKLGEAEKVKVDDAVFDLIARNSEGCLRDAESLLSQIFSLGEKNVTPEVAELVMPSLSTESVTLLVEAIVMRDAPSSLSIWERLSLEGAELSRVIADIIDITRRMTLAHLREAEYEAGFPVTEEQKEKLKALQSRLSPAEGAELLEKLIRIKDEMKRVELVELPFEMMVMDWCEKPAVRPVQAVQTPSVPPPTPKDDAPTAKQDDGPVPEQAQEEAAEPPADSNVALSAIKEKWNDIVLRSQEKNQGLPFMLSAGEIVDLKEGELRIGFQYVLYRDRLNGKCKRMLEEVISEVMKAKIIVKGVLLDKREEPEEKKEALPDGFSDLVNDFGGSLAS